MAEENKAKKQMSKQDKLDWDLLYQYVRTEIMLYDSNQSLSKQMVLRLKGMLNGKFYANNSTSNNADYSYKIVLLTFKLCKAKITSSLSSKTFDSENQKFNYICAIVENNLNDTYLRIKTANKTKEKTESMSMENVIHTGADYQSKTQKTTENLKDLW